MRTSGVFTTSILLTITGLGLTGCANHEVDRAAWERDLAATGIDTSSVDWAKLQAAYEDDLCQDDEDELAMFIAVSLDEGDDLAPIRASIANVCPDRSEDLEDAIDQVQGASNETDEACATDPSERTESQSRLAEAMGC